MKNGLIMALIGVVILDVSAADNNFQCGSTHVLQLLAQTIQNTNKISPNIVFNFDNIKTLPRSSRNSNSLKCTASLELVEKDDNSVMDSLKVNYQFSLTDDNRYKIVFEPVR